MNALHRHHHGLSTRSVFLLTLIACAILLAPSLLWDFAYDQGTFAYGGHAVLEGSKPYLDFWDIKPPNIFYVYSAAFAFLGESVFAIRLFDYLNALLTIALLFELSVRLWTGTPWGRLSAVMTSIVWSLQYYIMGGWNTAQPETYAVPWLLLAVLLLLPEREGRKHEKLVKGALAGFAIGIAFYFKYTNGVFLILAIAMLWISTLRLKENHMPMLFSVIGGFVLSFGLQTIYLWAQGSLPELVSILSSTMSYRETNLSGSFGLEENLRTLAQNLDLLWLVVAIIGWSLWSLDHDARMKYESVLYQTLLTLGLAAVLSLFVIQLQNKGYTYHYAIALPWLDILIGAGIANLAQSLHRIDALPRGSNAAIVVILLLVGSYVWTSPEVLQPRVREVMDIAESRKTPNSYIEGDSLSNYVLHHTAHGESIFIFGFHPYIYWRTDRAPANRFLNTIHFKPTYVESEARSELVASLVQRPPKLLLVETEDTYTSQGDSFDDSRTTIRNRYPEIEALLATYYDSTARISDVIAYTLRQ